MRNPSEVPPKRRRRPGRARYVLVAVVALVVLVIVSARGVAGFYTDYLWFDSLGFGGRWRGLIGLKAGVVALFAAGFFVLLWGNLLVAGRVSPVLVPRGGLDPNLEALVSILERRPRLVRAAVAVLLAVPFGAAAQGHWHDWLLFTNHTSFGVDDPLFHRDAGFYVFRLPFLSFLVDWLFGALFVTLLLVAVAHYLGGKIRPRGRRPRVDSGARAHLSILLAALALARGVSYYFDRFELLYSSRGVVDGAGYTDVNAELPALNLLIVISVLAAALFVFSIWRTGWTVPAIAVALWGLVSVVGGTVYPAVIQRFRVEPAESTREVQYIGRNITATREAMGLSGVEVKEFSYDEALNAGVLADNAETIRNVRLWDPQVLQRTYQRLQEVRSFYRFTDVDVDRYDIGGALTQIMLSARELNPEALPSDTWENRHLAFTHGFGAVLSPANAVTSEGQPDFLVRNIPPQGEPEISEPRLYHGEGIGGYAIVDTGRDEIDYLRDDGTAVANRYEGAGGVGVGSPLRRLAFALRFGDINPLISGFMTSDSRILYMRDVRERVKTIAPFLHVDHDPYPVVLDGRILWIVDAYTTSSHYPYAQRADVDRVTEGSGLRHDFNYVRNSIKVTVDAYTGATAFHIVDPDDPLAAAYASAFPELFAEHDISDDLRRHFRYPEDLFRVQTNMWGRYHIGDPNEFYSQSDRWNIAQDPGSGGGPTPVMPAPQPGPAEPAPSQERRMDPYYLNMRLPGAPSTEFLILQPFVPFSQDDTRRELSAFMVAKADPHDYGKLQVFVMPRDRQVDGPAIVNARINQNPEISQLITLLSRAGSEVLLGNLIIVPVEQSLIYVRPLYVQATGANAVPELKNVIVVFGDRIAIRDTFQDALASVFGDAPETLEERAAEPSPDQGTGGPQAASADVRRLLDDAARAFDEADQALRNGDPVGYAQKVQDGRAAFQQARQAAGTSVPPPTSATTAPTTVPPTTAASGG